jgi:hypothetical protein
MIRCWRRSSAVSVEIAPVLADIFRCGRDASAVSPEISNSQSSRRTITCFSRRKNKAQGASPGSERQMIKPGRGKDEFPRTLFLRLRRLVGKARMDTLP